MGTKVYVQTLGCPKNLVDSEIMLGLAAREGAEIVLDPEAADVYLVNTCAFIGPAKQESIDAILELARYKEEDPSRRLIVTGCLAQRYGADLQESLPEVDAFLGTGDFDRLPEILRQNPRPDASRYGGAAHLLPDLSLPRVRTGAFYSAYLKVSEGCDHKCSFCIIPKIRGRHQSRPLDSVLAEAERLVSEGVVEINLIAQDLTAYGRDLRNGTSLASLLRRLGAIDGLRWIRLLYTYPNFVDAELLAAIAETEAVCRYVDMPLQHISDAMLRRMRRERSGDSVRKLIARIRAAVPGVALRTSMIVGFPGETDDDFQQLLAFVDEARFERLGVFEYSPEEGTAAGTMPSQVPARTKKRRYHALMKAQARVSAELNAALVGSLQEVLVCGESERGDLVGRLASQAPDIDGLVHLEGDARPGEFVQARIESAEVYDLRARVEDSRIDSRAVRPYTAAPFGG